MMTASSHEVREGEWASRRGKRFCGESRVERETPASTNFDPLKKTRNKGPTDSLSLSEAGGWPRSIFLLFI